MKRVLEGKKESCDETEAVTLLSLDPLEARQGSHCFALLKTLTQRLGRKTEQPS